VSAGSDARTHPGMHASTSAGPHAAAESLVDAGPALRLAATRIRARLGAWAAPGQAWNIWSGAELKTSVVCGPGNLVVRIDTAVTVEQQASWLSSGAALLTVAYRQATLSVNGEIYRISGNPEPQWLAAFAAFLDCGCVPQDALCWAWGWRDGAHAEHDWPTDPDLMPQVLGLPALPAGHAYPDCPRELGLYPVVPDAQWVERLLAAGVKTIQLRLKHERQTDGDIGAQGVIEREIARAVAAGQAYQARVFINDHWQAALDAGAYGVHLGQEDLQVADLSAIARAGVRLGLSTHGVYEMLLAWHYRPSYLAFGAVFPTQTKQLASMPQGIARLGHFADLFAARVSTVAIGGIDLARLPQVLATGVGSAAVVRAVTAAADLDGALAALKQAFAQGAA